jgi:hypothetical protein
MVDFTWYLRLTEQGKNDLFKPVLFERVVALDGGLVNVEKKGKFSEGKTCRLSP